MSNEEINNKLRQLYEVEEKSIQEAADAVGIDRSNASRRLDKMGVKKRKECKKYKIDLPLKEVRDLYEKEGMNPNQIAEKYNVSDWLVRERLKDMGIYVETPKLDLKDEDIRYYYLEEELSVPEVAEKLNAKLATVYYRIQKMGILKDQFQNAREIDDEELKSLKLDKGWSCRKIAQYYGCCPNTVTRRLQKLGISTKAKSLEEKYDIQKIKRLKNEGYDVRMIGHKLEMDYRTVEKCLELNVSLDQRPIKSSNYQREHRCEILSQKNDLPLEYIENFDDLNKFAFTLKKIKSATKKRKEYDYSVTGEELMILITHFYFDETFNQQYELYLETGNNLDAPSIDHIIPLAEYKKLNLDGNPNDISNLRCISWFENRVKSDLDLEDYLDAVERYYGFEARQRAEEKFNHTTNPVNSKYCLPNEADVLLDDFAEDDWIFF